MTEYCEFSTFCPIFAVLQDPSRKHTRDAYCYGEFGECKRRQKMLAGETVEDTMLPHGGVVLADDNRPRTIF